MQRILIIGNCGTGKTTFSRQLAQRLSLPLIHLDQHYWQPHWTPTPKEEWRNTVQNLVKGKSWIMEGNYRSTFDIRIPAADTIIFLDFPSWFSIWRVLKRFFTSLGTYRPELGGENMEKMDFAFLKWVATYPRQQTYADIKRLRTSQNLIVVRSPFELNPLLKSIL